MASELAIDDGTSDPEHHKIRFHALSRFSKNRDATLTAGRAFIKAAASETRFLGEFLFQFVIDESLQGKYGELVLAAGEALAKLADDKSQATESAVTPAYYLMINATRAAKTESKQVAMRLLELALRANPSKTDEIQEHLERVRKRDD